MIADDAERMLLIRDALKEGMEPLRRAVVGACRPVVVTLPDGSEVLVRHLPQESGEIVTKVDVRSNPCRSWVPIELCGGRFEVRDE